VVVGGALAALAVLVGSVVPGLVAPQEPPIAGLPRGAAIPDRLVTPPPRLSGTRDGPIGPLAVIAGAARERGGSGASVETGIVGVSAETGEYRFLDLPGAFWPDEGEGHVVALSPDGRHVAYWLRHPDHVGWAAGWATYDTVTGKFDRHRFTVPLGIADRVLAWTSRDSLAVRYGKTLQRTADGWVPAPGYTQLDWRSPQIGSRPSIPTSLPSIDWVAPTREGFAAHQPGLLAQWESSKSGPVSRVGVSGDEDAYTGTVSPDGEVLVTLGRTAQGGEAAGMRIGAVGQYGVDLAPIDLGLTAVDLLGWTDDDHVVVRAMRGGAYTVDVRTGQHELLVREDRENRDPQPQFATELWARSTVSRPTSEGPTPWWWYVVGAGGVIATAYGVRRWRRGQA
jgi:hypothetical protein